MPTRYDDGCLLKWTVFLKNCMHAHQKRIWKSDDKKQQTTTATRIMLKIKTAYCCLIMNSSHWIHFVCHFFLFSVCPLTMPFFLFLFGIFPNEIRAREKSNTLLHKGVWMDSYRKPKERPWQANIHTKNPHRVGSTIMNRMSYYIPSIFNIVIYYYMRFFAWRL